MDLLVRASLPWAVVISVSNAYLYEIPETCILDAFNIG
jgi:hypothetical protein